MSAGSLALSVAPLTPSKIYYDIGDTIVFAVGLKHNTSLSAVSVSNVAIRLTSEFLTLTSSGLQKSSSGSFSSSEGLSSNVLTLSLTGSSFISGNTYYANITAVVKDTIGPMTSLIFTAELNATTDVYIKQKSTPALYATYPKVNLTRESSNGKLYLCLEIYM